MSTYTDYKCERKENLTVLRKPGCPSDGITPQKVIFANEANIYKGHFEGTIDVKDMVFDNVHINNSIVNNSILNNSILSANNIKIGVDELLNEFSGLCADVNEVKDDVESLKLCTEYLSSRIDTIKIECLSDINDISTVLSGNLSVLSAEVLDLSSATLNLSNNINIHIEDFNNHVEDFNNHVEDFNNHVEDNERQFAYFEEYMLSSIMHDKHYQIYTSAKLTDVKPYKLHDFGINIIEDTIDDATITFDDNVIGYASRFKDSSGNNCIKISISGASKNPKLSAILPDPYNVDMLPVADPRPIKHGTGFYTIEYIDTPSNLKLQLRSNADAYIDVTDIAGNRIGYISNYKVDDSSSDNYKLLSGTLNLQYNGNVKEFNDFIEYIPNFTFTETVLSSSIVQGYRISIQSDHRTFLFESDIKSYKYLNVKANGYGDIACIYENSYITLDDGALSSFTIANIKLNNDDIGTAVLTRDNQFKSYSSTPGYIVEYNEANSTIDISAANTWYKYEFKTNDGYIIPQGLNTKLEDNPNVISVNIKIPIADTFLDSTYELTNNGEFWQYSIEKNPINGDYLDIIYSDGKVTIKGNAGNIDYSTIINEPYEIDVNNPIPYYENPTHIVTSEPIEFTFDNEKTVSLPENQHSAYSTDIHDDVNDDPIDLVINNLDADHQVVKFVIPEKTNKYYDCSREFIVASKIQSVNDNVKIKFLEHDGSDANIIIDDGTQLNIWPANKLVILQLNEIKQNEFFARYYTNDNLNIISANIQTLTATNVDLSNTGISNLTATNVDLSNTGISNLTATNLSNETADIVNAGISNLTATTSDLSNAGISNLTATTSDLSNAGISSLTATNLSNETADIVNAGISNLTATNSDLSIAGISNLTATNVNLSNAGISSLTATNISAEKLSIDLSNLINKNSETSSKYPNINQFIQSVDLSVDAISSNLADIWKNMRGGLNYKDNLCIDINYADDDEKITTISGLIYENIRIKTRKSDEDIKSIRLREGFFFILESEEKTYRRVLDGHELEYGDWLIIKNNSILSNLTSSDVRIFDAQDYDSFRLSNDNIISGNNLFYGSLSSVGITYISALTATSTTITDSILTNAGISSLTATNLSNETADIVNAGISNLTATNSNLSNAGISSLTATNVDLSNTGISNLTATNLSAKNTDLVNACISNLTATNSDLLNAGISSLTATNLSNETADIVNAGISNLTATNSDLSNAGISSLTATNLSAENTDLVNVGISNLTAINISVDKLSITLSNVTYNGISTLNDLCVDLQNQITSAQLSIDSISTLLGKEVFNDVQYFGTIPVGYNHNSLTTFLHDGLSALGAPSPLGNYHIQQGYQYRISASCNLSDNTEHIIRFGVNDYILFNTSCVLSNVTWENIDIIRDAQHEGEQLSGLVYDLSGHVSSLSGELCATSSLINLSAEGISAAVTELSTHAISSISALSNDLSTLSIDISAISTQITSNIDYLSSELSDYHNTLSGIDRERHDKDVGHVIETDNLMLTDVTPIDENAVHPKYYMTMLSGTLVLKAID